MAAKKLGQKRQRRWQRKCLVRQHLGWRQNNFSSYQFLLLRLEVIHLLEQQQCHVRHAIHEFLGLLFRHVLNGFLDLCIRQSQLGLQKREGKK